MKKIGIVLGIVVVLLLVVMFVARGNKETAGNGDDNTIELKKGELVSQVIETGSLDAIKTVEVKSRVSGRVSNLYVDEGDVVVAGQLIAKIDPEELQFRVEQDKARLRGAQSQIDRLEVEISQREVTTITQLARANSRVEQLKLELDAQPTLTRTEIESAETTYNSAVNSRDLLSKVSHPNQRTSFENQVKEATANQYSAQSEYDRVKRLLERGFNSERQFEAAENQLALANSRLNTASDQLARLDSEQRIDMGQADEAVRQAKSGLDRALTNTFRDAVKRQEYERALSDLLDAQTAQLDIQALEANSAQQVANVTQIQNTLNDSLRLLRETEIVAPISGIVTKRLVQEGELVASLSGFSAGTPVVRIEDRSKMLVKLEINEIDVYKLELGMKSVIKVEAMPAEEFTGTVTKIAPTNMSAGATGQQPGGNNSVVKYQVEVSLDNSDDSLKSGMSAKCTMTVLDRKDVLVLPRQYVGKEKNGDYYVMLPVENKEDTKAKPEKVAITIGDSSASLIEVLSGIEEGTMVQKPEFDGPDRKGMMEFGPDDDEESEEDEKE